MEVRLPPFDFYKNFLVLFGCVIPANSIKVDQRTFFCNIFDLANFFGK